MAEPIATSKPEVPAAEAATGRDRFEHVAPAAVPELEAAAVEVEVAAASAPAEEPAAVAVEPEASRPEPVVTEEKPKAAAPVRAPAEAPAAHEWPVAWLRLVEPEPQAPQDDAVAAVLAAEAADADGVAHAFGQAMAAALNPEGEDESAAKSEPEAETGPQASPELEVAAVEHVAANDADPLEPVRLGVARPRRVQIEEDAPVAMDDGRPPEPPSEAPAFNPRLYAPRTPSAPRDDHELQGARSGEGGVAMMVYLLYLAGFLCLPAILGVIIALNARRDAPEWLESHYIFQIRTFWIGLVGVAIAGALLLSGALTLAGLTLGLFLVVWLLGRSALGFINVVKLRPYPHPLAWLL